MAQVSMFPDEWLSRYELLENYTREKTFFEGFNLQPHPLAWSQGPDAMECKLTVQGIYGPI